MLVRRVVGDSMLPKLKHGQLIIAIPMLGKPHPGQVVVVRHDSKEKVKRIERIEGGKVFVIGDNLSASTDSRQFGWLDNNQVAGLVVWPLGLSN